MHTNDLLALLEEKGGCIVCSAKLDEVEIAKAREENRMVVDRYGIGFIWLPENYMIVNSRAIPGCPFGLCYQNPVCQGACRYKNEN